MFQDTRDVFFLADLQKSIFCEYRKVSYKAGGGKAIGLCDVSSGGSAGSLAGKYWQPSVAVSE
jgi:hypothetical protein